MASAVQCSGIYLSAQQKGGFKLKVPRGLTKLAC